MIRLRIPAAWAACAALLAAACTETNIAPAPPDTTAGVIVFASNRQDQNFEIYAIGPDGRGLRRLTTDRQHNDFHPVLSRDGQRIAWEREIAVPGAGVVATEIWMMDADGGNARPVVQNGASNVSPSFTADGASLVYASDITGDWEIYRVPAGGGAAVNLTHEPFADQAPRVSADGSRIVFQSNRDLNFEIYSMRLDGTDVRNLSNGAEDDRFPAWTPDGTRIVWSRYIDSFDLWIMNADGTGKRPLLETPFSEVNASVSPDGASVVYQTDRVPPASLFVLPLRGGALRQLTNGTGWTSGTDFAPDWGVARR
jgi:TolB protein